MYVPRYILLLLPIVLFAVVFQNANAAIQIDPASIYYNDSGSYVPYKLINNVNSANILTLEGSYVFDKNACSLSLVDNNGNTIGSDSYSILASQGSTGIWNPVNIINNAACQTVLSENHGTVTVTGTKAVTGAGVFQINYTKAPLQKVKQTFSATNNNPSWTNYHIGLAENITVPQFIRLGNQTYDLSQFNGTTLNRSWIASHNAQLVHLANNLSFDMGIGWNHVNDITIHWINNKASLTIDYTYNTPILSPGQTITIDPSIGFNTSTDTFVGTAGATSTANITIGSNSNRILVVHLTYTNAAPTVTSVKIGTTSFTHLKQQALGSNIWIDTYYLIAPPTGAQTVTVTWGASGYTNVSIGLVSFYNVDQTTGINSASANSTNSGNIDPQKINITPTVTGSWIIQYGVASNVFTSATFSGTEIYKDSAAGVSNAAQYNSSPTIGSKNTLSITRSNVAAVTGSIAYEIEQVIASPPSAPVLLKVNTLNSTAINATFTQPTGTTFNLLYITLSGGATTHINTTSSYVLLNNYTAGSKYTFQAFAGNGSGTSSGSATKYNYTTNIAPTSPIASLITASQARITVTNPSGNFSGYNVYKVTATGSNYTLAGTSTNTTNHFDLTGLAGNRQYTSKFATLYAVGSNYSGVSSNSTTVTFYTLPNPPTSLTAIQTAALTARLSWVAPTDNGTVSGYKVEQSTDNVSWSVLSANTGNTTTTYTKVEPSTGIYYFRVSTIKYGGTSVPSNTASKVITDNFVFTAYHADNSTAVYGQVIQANSTSSNNRTPLVGGVATLQGISGLNNFTAWNSLINFIVGKQYNYNATKYNALTMATNDYNVDCPYTGTGDDIELWTNGTNGHRITAFTTPVCLSNGTVKWKTDFTSNGNSATSYSTTVYIKILNATYLANAPLKYNSTVVTTALSDPYVVSAPVTVGTATTSAVKTFYWSMNLTISPLYLPVNFTVGHLSVSGTNPVTAPITFSSTAVNSTATAVTVTFPSTYTMGYQLTFGNEGTNTTLTGLPVTSPSLGLGQSTITFLNPSNDLVTIRAYDIPTNTTARYILAQPNNQIPFVAQILAFKNGTFGTSAMIGGIDIVSLIILIVAMIGLNRVNETVGAVMMIIIIGVCGYFGIIEWPTIMTSAIALVLLVIVTTTKKLPWS